MKKILFLAANPSDTAHLRLGEEFRDIENGFRGARHRDNFELVHKPEVRVRDLQKSLLNESPQIIHFSGHGEGKEGLVFKDESGQTKLISTEALAGLFKLFANSVECVLLNGCYSEAQAESIFEYIDCVIGMRQAIRNGAAIEFAVSFYNALGAGKSFEFAYHLACNAIQLSAISPSQESKRKLISDDAADKEFPAASSGEHLIPKLFIRTDQAPASSDETPIQIFLSSAEEDKKLREKLKGHLKVLQRTRNIDVKDRRDVRFGVNLKDEIKRLVEAANIILILVSDNYIFSDFCFEYELPLVMSQSKNQAAVVIPIILEPGDWEELPFEELSPLPSNRVPVTLWNNQNEAFREIVKGVRGATILS